MAQFKDVHIIGGGIAGYAASQAFARSDLQVHIWEKENRPFLYSSSKNSAMGRSYEADPILSILLKKSLLKMYQTKSEHQPFIEPVGLLIKPLEYDYQEAVFCSRNRQFQNFKSRESSLTLPDGSVFTGRLIPDNGFLNLPNIFSYFEEEANNTYLHQHFFKKIEMIEHNDVKINRVYFSHPHSNAPEKIEFDDSSLLVNAAGSWACEVIEKNMIKAPPLTPYKRHMFRLSNPENWFADSPIVWDEVQEFYIRRLEDDLLVSYCDEIESNPSDYEKETSEPARLSNVLDHKFSFLAKCKIKEYWSCLRTFTTDARPVIGFDPIIKNLFWVVGLGGKGISMSFELIDLIYKIFRKKRDGNENEIKNPFTALRFI